MICSEPYTGMSAERDGLLALGVDLRICCPRGVIPLFHSLKCEPIGHSLPGTCLHLCPPCSLQVPIDDEVGSHELMAMGDGDGLKRRHCKLYATAVKGRPGAGRVISVSEKAGERQKAGRTEMAGSDTTKISLMQKEKTFIAKTPKVEDGWDGTVVKAVTGIGRKRPERIGKCMIVTGRQWEVVIVGVFALTLDSLGEAPAHQGRGTAHQGRCTRALAIKGGKLDRVEGWSMNRTKDTMTLCWSSVTVLTRQRTKGSSVMTARAYTCRMAMHWLRRKLK
ncbi:hypothetical protein DFH08DRAFT_811917 [Mycena albidolilacea]|uniref:Uncharacterized protein n=1 Tax=Mycena albidolilacea TaxID=1033008 RepID=A0AAD6ZV16_9AGAR|nr:hypothetical protein DFH08DRAFT_811917 [Mycena albidolilacea]